MNKEEYKLISEWFQSVKQEYFDLDTYCLYNIGGMTEFIKFVEKNLQNVYNTIDAKDKEIARVMRVFDNLIFRLKEIKG